VPRLACSRLSPVRALFDCVLLLWATEGILSLRRDVQHRTQRRPACGEFYHAKNQTRKKCVWKSQGCGLAPQGSAPWTPQMHFLDSVAETFFADRASLWEFRCDWSPVPTAARSDQVEA
jgi:hypothetical protein